MVSKCILQYILVKNRGCSSAASSQVAGHIGSKLQDVMRNAWYQMVIMLTALCIITINVCISGFDFLIPYVSRRGRVLHLFWKL